MVAILPPAPVITEPIPPSPGITGFPDWRRIPTMDSDDETCKQFIARVINHKARIRRWAVVQAALNQRFYLADQWVRASRAQTDGQNYRFVLDRRYQASYRWTTNRIARSADNEIGRISSKEFVPTARPARGVAYAESAARAAKAYLTHRLTKLNWDGDKREDAIAHMVIHGTVALVSTWDETSLADPRLVSEAMRCPSCGLKYGTQRLPAAMTELFKHTESVQPVMPTEPDEEPQVEFDRCVMCGSPDALQPYEPTREDLATEDPFGLPLGILQPEKSETGLEVLPIFWDFPANGGHGVQPNTMPYHGYEVPRSLEWIAEHHGHQLDPEKLYPEDPHRIFSQDPVLGGEFSQWWSSAGDSGVYDDHALVKTIAIKPHWGCETGLVLTQVNDQIIKRPLLQTYTDAKGEQQTVEIVKIATARYKRIPNLYWGRTPMSDAIGPQRRINRIDTMQTWLREHGQPQLYLPDTTSVTNIDEQEDEEGLALRRFRVTGAPQGWSLQKALFPGQPLTGNAYEQERQAAINDLEFIFGPAAIDQGITTQHDPKTTTGLALLSRKAEESRGPAETAFSQMVSTVAGHQLELTQAYVTDEDTYAVKTAAGRAELRKFQAAEIKDHVDIEIEVEGHDESVNERRDGTLAAINAHLYDLTEPDAQEQALENMELPLNVNENRGIQRRIAEDAWSGFVTNWEIPSVDPVLHDPRIWFSILGRRWLDYDAAELKKAAKWDAIQPKVSGWKQNLALETDRDQKQRQAYGNIPPEQWQTQYLRLAMQYDEARKARDVAAEKSVDAGGAGMLPPVPEPPEPPDPNSGFLPLALEERIAIVLLRMVGMPAEVPHPTTKGLVPEAQAAALLERLIRFYAVILAFGELRAAAIAPAPGGVGEVAQPGMQPQPAVAGGA